jgi:probable HAF family extracellular repeat protein
MVGLGDLAGGSFFSQARGASSDGSVVVGQSQSASGTEAFRWAASGGMVGLGQLPGGTFSQAFGVSADGSVVVGLGLAGSGFEAFRWTAAGGMVGLGDLPGGSFFSRADGVSADGSVVVGTSLSASGSEAFRWTSAGGIVGLGDLPGGGVWSFAQGVSADGSVVVGNSDSASGPEAFRWTSGGGMVGLGDLAGGGFNSIAWAASADGSVVVGAGSTAAGNEAFIWDTTNGMRSVKDVLVALGVDVTGWRLDAAIAVSADGNVIVGTGINPSGSSQGWLARLSPEPPDPGSDATLIGPLGCVIKAGHWSGDVDLICTKCHKVTTPSGIVNVKCTFDIPAGKEPKQAVVIKGFTCNLLDEDGNVIATTTDSHSVSTPSGKVHLTCHFRPPKPTAGKGKS